VSDEALLERGVVAPVIAEELPGLAVWSCAVGAPARTPDAGVRERLALLGERFHGARAVELRREPVPAAHRVFFRHVGLDPEVTRTPIEAAALERLVAGGHRSGGGRLDDALLLALLETGVQVLAFDLGVAPGPVGLRGAAPGERLGSDPALPLPAGRLLLDAAGRPLAELFGVVDPAAWPGRRTSALRLVAVQVPGVPDICVEEALWTCQEALGTPPARYD
jgi:DNA/RNA-binding domain of Phe-tRNA-synthetase-like protein